MAARGLYRMLGSTVSTASGHYRKAPASFVSKSYDAVSQSAPASFVTNVVSRRAQSGLGGMECGKDVVTLVEAKRFMVDSLMAVGTCAKHACAMADLLVEADYRGHQSHGLNRLDMYVQDVQQKTCDPNAEPYVVKETAATAFVDGNNGFGVVVGNYCMKLAIQKAKECGVGWVVAKHSNHYGIAGWYSMQAVDAGLLGMSFTNTSPLMCPTGAKKAALGTNPLTLAAPGNNCDSFVLDMATTAVAVGKIEMQVRKKEPMPEGWALGPDGQPTTDAELGFQTGCLLPLGGTKITSGYKGYGLGMLVEIFSGVLAGSNFGPKIRKWKDDSGDKPTEANLGQCFVAINPKCFEPGFEDRMSWLMGYLRGMEPADCSEPVLVAGDPERENMSEVDARGGIIYHKNQLKASKELAKCLGIAPMRTL